MSDGFVLELRGAGLKYGPVHALDGVDIAVRTGERVAVIGPSGAGKSSLIGLLNGTAAPTAGRVRVLGVDLATASARELRKAQRRLGTVRQRLDLVDQLRAVHNVNAGRLGTWPLWKAALSLAVPRDVDAVRSALDRLGIADKVYERTGRLSGGEQQRIAIARVLVQQPTAILADEPIASLDPARGREVIELLCGISAERGTTLLASLHDVDVALAYFDRVVGLREGRIAFDATPATLPRAALDDLYAVGRQEVT